MHLGLAIVDFGAGRVHLGLAIVDPLTFRVHLGLAIVGFGAARFIFGLP